jgi:site-specific DNA recombinase
MRFSAETVALRRSALRQVLLGDAPSITSDAADLNRTGSDAAADEHVIHIPARLKRSAGEMRLVVPPAHAKALHARPNPSLIKALARAHAWKRKLLAGAAPSLRAIAKQEGMTEPYLGRIIRLAFLAPDIVEAILDGHQPADLELKRLTKNIPLRWDEQRRAIDLT